jgi:hypothetical protein
MSNRNTRAWQELFIAGAAVAILQMLVLQPSAEAAADILSPKSSLAVISVLPVEPGTAAAGGACAECSTPAPILERVTGLVITTSLHDGGYVAVWQNRYDNIVYGQSFSRENQPRGDVFRINAEVKDGVLPLILSRRGGGFVAKWQQDGQRHEQHFSPEGSPLGKVTPPE